MRRRKPPPGSPLGPFERSPEEWATLGQVQPFSDGWGDDVIVPSREDAALILVEQGALSAVEVAELRQAASGSPSVLDMPRRQAALTLARWCGPIPGLRLLPLAHWTRDAA